MAPASHVAWIVGAASILGALAVPAPQEPSALAPRAQLEGLERALDRSVTRLSRAALAHPLGVNDGCRGYYLKGSGAVFVLAPRVLPTRNRRQVLAGRHAERAFEQAMREVQKGLPRVASDALRREIETALEQLRRSVVEHEAAVAAARADLESARAREKATRDLARRRRTEAQQSAWNREVEKELSVLARQAEAFWRQAEQARAAAEQALEQALQEGELRIEIEASSADLEAPPARASARRQPSASGVAVAVPGRPVPPSAPAAPAAQVPPEAPVQPEAPAAPAAPAPPAAPATTPAPAALPPPPPWSFWFEVEDEEDRTPDQVIADVGNAVASALESYGGQLKVVRPEEEIVVAVDFVPRGFLLERARSERTLVVRVRKRELDERLAGKLAVDEFRRRVRYETY